MNENLVKTTHSSIFSEEEVKRAENMLMILALVSANYWADALISEYFVVNGKLFDYTTGYKNRVTKIESDPNAQPLTAKQIQIFKDEYLNLAKEQIQRYLANDIAIANLLQQRNRVVIPLGRDCSSFSFGGWDNDPDYITAKAMKKAKIIGKMRGRYTKIRLTLLVEDWCIHEGCFTYKPIIYKVK
ncbi:MAG: hypothetical protein J6J60_08860 [Clostridia bacterium]|nr:hypothetical protein [Clostridia bacterium]